jgi:hypothetical protein
MAGNASFNTLLSTTIDNYIPTLTDVVFGSRPFLWVLENEGRMQNKEGGTNCNVPLLYAESVNHGSYAGKDVFNTDDDENITIAQYPWRQYYGLVLIEGIEEAKNSGGKTQILDLLETRLKALEMTIAENLDQMFLGDGSGNGGKDFIGLKAIVSASNPSWGNLGGIPVAGNSWWTSDVDSTAETLATFGLSGMANSFNDASEGNDHPNYIFTTQILFEAYEALLTSNARYLDPQVADAGFQNLLFKGVPITFDKYVDAGYMYFINTDYITFYKLANTWFKPSEWVVPANQDVRYKYLKLYGQLTTNNRSRHSVHTAFTNT